MPKQVEIPMENGKSFSEIYEHFVVAQTTEGVTDVTLRNYHYHMKRIAEENAKKKNTRIDYLYREAVNYKVWSSYLVEGKLTEEQQAI